MELELEPVLALLSQNPIFGKLRLDALKILAETASWVDVRSGEHLMSEGDPADALFIVESGHLFAEIAIESTPLEIGSLGPGDVIGESAIVGVERRSAGVVARTDARLLRIGRDGIDRALRADPAMVGAFAEVVRHRLLASRLRSMLNGLVPDDGAVEMVRRAKWIDVERGEAVFKEGDPADSWYFVVDGWLGDFRVGRKGQAPSLNAELHRGDAFGELELVLEIPRSRTVQALRDSTCVRFTRSDFEFIISAWPQLMMTIAKKLFARLAPRQQQQAVTHSVKIAVLPVHPSIDIEAFGRDLEASFARLGAKVTRATVARIEAETGLRGLSDLPPNDPTWARADLWFERAADRSDVVLVQAESTPTTWSLRAGLNADRLIAVAPSDTVIDREFMRSMLPKRGSPATQMLASMRETGSDEPLLTRRSLVMLHPEGARVASGTRVWADEFGAEQIHHLKQGASGDVDRMVRVLFGRAVGLALGGGGARGFAHIGVYRALIENGVYVDIIGGTSMGSIIASQIARGLTFDEMVQLNRDCVAVDPFTEYTIPMVALLKSRGIERVAKMSGGDAEIEDLWLQYFAISADLSNARMVIHDRGPVWEATRASGALPGIVLPVVRGQSLLVDGGIINNLPADVMRKRCGAGGLVIGVNVSPEQELTMKREAFPRQSQLFLQTLLRRRDKEIPTILDVLMRSTVLSSIDYMGQVKGDMDVFLAPDIDAFGTLDFDKMDEIIESGYRHTNERMAEIKAAIDGRYSCHPMAPGHVDAPAPARSAAAS